MVDEVGMVIYIPLWYLLIPAGRSACACLMRHLHSTMVSINRADGLRRLKPADVHLHSTMVSINHISHYVSSIERGIYIPLWYLLIGIVKCIFTPGTDIYIPLWYLLIGNHIAVVDQGRAFTFHYGIY